jgi:hypothetical protein
MEHPKVHLIDAFREGVNHQGGYLIHQTIRLPGVEDPREAAHVGARPASHLRVPVMHDPRLPLAVQRIRGREGDVEPLGRVRARREGYSTAVIEQFAWPVPASAVAHHCQEVVGREEASDRDQDEQAGRGLAGILPPANHGFDPVRTGCASGPLGIAAGELCSPSREVVGGLALRRRRRGLRVSGLPVWLDRAGESDSADLRSRSTADTAESAGIAGGDYSLRQGTRREGVTARRPHPPRWFRRPPRRALTSLR